MINYLSISPNDPQKIMITDSVRRVTSLFPQYGRQVFSVAQVTYVINGLLEQAGFQKQFTKRQIEQALYRIARYEYGLTYVGEGWYRRMI